jgi:hypothetical protein
MRLYRGIAVPENSADNTANAIQRNGLAIDAGLWRMIIYDKGPSGGSLGFIGAKRSVAHAKASTTCYRICYPTGRQAITRDHTGTADRCVFV